MDMQSQLDIQTAHNQQQRIIRPGRRYPIEIAMIKLSKIMIESLCLSTVPALNVPNAKTTAQATKHHNDTLAIDLSLFQDSCFLSVVRNKPCVFINDHPDTSEIR